MSTTPTTAASTTTPLRSRPWVRGLTYSVRLLVAGLVLWIGWSCATTFIDLLRDAPPQAASTQPRPGEAEPFAWQQIVADGGAWAFADSGWSAQVDQVAADALPTALVRPLADPSEFANLSEAERSILNVLDRLPTSPHERDGGSDFLYQGPAFQYFVRTITSAAGERRVAWARGAVHRWAGQWTLFEVRPGRSNASEPNVGGLLPNPSLTVPIAARLDRHGHVACEFLRVPGTLAELVEHWHRQQVETTPIVVGAAGLQELLCRSQGKSFHVAAFVESTTSGTTIFVAALDAATTATATSSAAKGSASNP